MPGNDRVRWVVARGKPGFEPLLKDLGSTFHGIGETIYQGRNIVKKLRWVNESITIKSFASPNQLNRYLYRWIRKSKSCRAFENATELSKRAINTPSPVGYIEFYRGPYLAKSFYVCSYWPSDFTARDVITNPNHPDRTFILAAIGSLAWQLHSKGVNFRDFSPGNILIRWTNNRELCLVDINRMRFQELSLKKRMQTFARLWASDQDLLTIVSGYVKESNDNDDIAVRLALRYSQSHKRWSSYKETVKTLLRLH
jgi:hypothetical protein